MTERESFTIHAEPVWRARADFLIHARIPDLGGFEQLWVRRLSEHSFEMCCIPFFIYDVALGDVVATVDVEGRPLVLSSVVVPSGRFVFRVYFDRTMFEKRADVETTLAGLGALLEWSSPSLLAVDARDLTHADEIAGYLSERERQGELLYETGKS